MLCGGRQSSRRARWRSFHLQQRCNTCSFACLDYCNARSLSQLARLHIPLGSVEKQCEKGERLLRGTRGTARMAMRTRA